MKRKPIPQKIRKQVYEKYNGHCAYCGCQLGYKDMQVDHVDAVYRSEAQGREVRHSVDNFNPACRMCNFYKGTLTVEDFRKKLLTFQVVHFPDSFNTRLGLKYGMMTMAKWDGKFYFEKEERK